MKILIASDAWLPQVNGVVRTYQTLGDKLTSQGHEVRYITPDKFITIPLIIYPEIKLAINHWFKIGVIIEKFKPDFIHVATEGPIGLAVRNYCSKNNYAFTTSYCTKFPEYINTMAKIPVSFTYKILKWFHKNSSAVMVSSDSIIDELNSHGIKRTVKWSRGVDIEAFHPKKKIDLKLEKPIYLYVGRISKEKSLEDFLKLNLKGTKLLVGDGPSKKKLEKKYTDAVFVGVKKGSELAQYYASSDIFVFPSKTDTFGMVMIEALASGLPVAAYPVPGPIDVFDNFKHNCLDHNLINSIDKARKVSRTDCINYSKKFDWHEVSKLFLSHQTASRVAK